MDKRTRNLFALALLAVVAVTGGAAFLAGGTAMNDPEIPPGWSSVDGVVVGVDSEGLGDVRSFDLRTTDGRILTFGLAELQNGVEFPPGHLAEHQATAEPVRVWYREDVDGRSLAMRLEDAPP